MQSGTGVATPRSVTVVKRDAKYELDWFSVRVTTSEYTMLENTLNFEHKYPTLQFQRNDVVSDCEVRSWQFCAQRLALTAAHY